MSRSVLEIQKTASCHTSGEAAFARFHHLASDYMRLPHSGEPHKGEGADALVPRVLEEEVSIIN